MSAEAPQQQQQGLTALVLGATGATGSQVLASALSPSSHFTRVVSLGRRAPSIPPSSASASTSTKFEHVSLDFDLLLSRDPAEQQKVVAAGAGADVVICALGTTRAAAGGMEGFVRIDREFVLEACRLARRKDDDERGKGQRLVYCSSGGASSSSLFPYTKSKGLTEEGLAGLGYSQTIIFRPGMLVVPGGRGEFRLLESIGAKITGVLAHFTSSIQIHTPVLGRAMIQSALLGRDELESKGLGHVESLNGNAAWVVGNAEAMKLGAGEEK